jgi:hypothetical protein
MPDHAKVLLVEYAVPTGPQPCLAKAMDLRTISVPALWILLAAVSHNVINGNDRV